MSGAINVEGVMLFEQPFTRVPYENYRRVFRTSQRNIEREFSLVQTATNDLAKQNGNNTEALNSVDGLITKVESLKRKLEDLQDTTGAPTQAVIRERLNHLNAVELAAAGTDDSVFSRWADMRLDRWLVDWTLRKGKERTARQIASNKQIESLVDINLFTDIRRIELALRNHSCSEALAWCNENKTQLRKVKSTLEFELRLQEYIEMARARKTQEAIAYFKKHLAPWQDTHLAQIRQASALLAFAPSTNCGPYKRLYDSSRWNGLVNSLRLAIYNLNMIPAEPLLNLALYAGLASLKLPACFDHSTKNADCPVCDGDSGDHSGSILGPGLGRLAEEVPFSHHVNSTIVCRLSGKIMNEDNPPMAFPNGYVYSRDALEDMAARNNGTITCPRSHMECTLAELKKVFIS